MAKSFLVKSPDGTEYDVDGPDNGTQAQAIDYVKRKFGSTKLEHGIFPAAQQGVYHGLSDVPDEVVDFGSLATKVMTGVDYNTIANLFGTEVPRAGKAIRRGINLAGKELGAKTNLTYENPEEVRPSDRPFAAFGEAVGGMLPLIIGTESIIGGAAKAMETAEATSVPSSMIGKYVQQAIKTAGKLGPVKSGMKELGLALSSGTGALVAEVLDPGSKTARAVGEALGGFISPGAIVERVGSGLYKSAREGVSSVMTQFSEAGRINRTAEYLQTQLRNAGEDPQKIAALLRSTPQPAGTKLTSAQLSGDPTLMALEKHLEKVSPKFGAAASVRMNDGLKALRLTIESLIAQGSPEALQTAAKLRAQYFENLLEEHVQEAEQRATDAIAGAFPSGRTPTSEASTEAHAVLEDALSDARKTERSLWSEVPKTIPAKADNLTAKEDEIRAELLPNEGLPEPAAGFLKTVRGRGKPTVEEGGDNTVLGFIKRQEAMRQAGGEPVTTTGELITFRSRLLDLARSARGQGNFADARHYSMLAQAALDDLSAVTSEEVTKARDFSRALNDVFTRTFSGEALAERATGAPRIAPEIMLDRAFGSGRQAGDVRFQQLTGASKFAGQPFEAKMSSIQERFLRQKSAELVGPDGFVNADRLNRFRTTNAEMLKRFPQLDRDLEDVESAQRALDAASNLRTQATKAMAQRAAFSKLVGAENTTAVVGRVVTSSAPDAYYGQLARMARASGNGTLAGLRASTLDYAFQNAMKPDGSLSWTKFDQMLNQRDALGRPSMLELMQRHGVMDAKAAKEFSEVVSRARRIEDAVSGKIPVSDIEEEPDQLIDFVLRVAGSRIGSIASRFTGGATLIAQSAGSKLLRSRFEKVPNLRIQDMLVEAASNPDFMATLLEKPSTPKAVQQAERNLNLFLINAGLTSMQPDNLDQRR